MDLYPQTVHMDFFSPPISDYFENTVTSKFTTRRTAMKLPIKNKGATFSFPDTRLQQRA